LGECSKQSILIKNNGALDTNFHLTNKNGDIINFDQLTSGHLFRYCKFNLVGKIKG